MDQRDKQSYMDWIEDLLDVMRYGYKQYLFMYRKGSKKKIKYRSKDQRPNMKYSGLEQGKI